jgi:hypothetical protein
MSGPDVRTPEDKSGAAEQIKEDAAIVTARALRCNAGGPAG